jgi:hypothetical protein
VVCVDYCYAIAATIADDSALQIDIVITAGNESSVGISYIKPGNTVYISAADIDMGVFAVLYVVLQLVALCGAGNEFWCCSTFPRGGTVQI